MRKKLSDDRLRYWELFAGIGEIKSMAAELIDLRARLAKYESAQQDEGQPLRGVPIPSGRKFFMYSDDSGFEKYYTLEAAINAAREFIDDCRDNCEDGWPEEVETVCWGIIIQKAEETDFQLPSENNNWLGSCDFKLTHELSPQHAWLASDIAVEVRNGVSVGVFPDRSLVNPHYAQGWNDNNSYRAAMLDNGDKE